LLHWLLLLSHRHRLFRLYRLTRRENRNILGYNNRLNRLWLWLWWRRGIMHNWGRDIGDNLRRSWGRLRLRHWDWSRRRLGLGHWSWSRLLVDLSIIFCRRHRHGNRNWSRRRSRSRRLMLNNRRNLSCSLLSNSTLLMNIDNR
jgi:hypothetical protein